MAWRLHERLTHSLRKVTSLVTLPLSSSFNLFSLSSPLSPLLSSLTFLLSPLPHPLPPLSTQIDLCKKIPHFMLQEDQYFVSYHISFIHGSVYGSCAHLYIFNRCIYLFIYFMYRPPCSLIHPRVNIFPDSLYPL